MYLPNRKTFIMTGFLVFCSLFTGCGTQEQAITATPKSQAEAEATSNEASSVDSSAAAEGTLFQALNATSHYAKEITDSNEDFKVSIDANVEIPAVNSISNIPISEYQVDDAFVLKFTNTFLPNAVFYDRDEYSQPTKQELKNKIQTLQDELDTKNYDPEKFGMEVEGEIFNEGKYRKTVERAISALREQIKTAPDTVTLKTTTPMISNSDIYGNYYTAESPDGYSYTVIVQDFTGYQLRITRDETPGSQQVFWGDYTSATKEGLINATKDEIAKKAGITYEKAREQTDEKIASLGLGDFTVNSWDYSYLADTTEAISVNDITAAGISLHYVRTIQDIPITYTSETGGALPDMDSDIDTWMYEQLDVVVLADGTESVTLCSPYVIDENSTTIPNLMNFSDIMDIFENMMVVEMQNLQQTENSRTYTIDRIKLGYMRIYDPLSSTNQGTLIPVWDFFGGFECSSSWDGETVESKNYLADQSYMTINAVDGSIIDRGLGY